MNLLRLKLHFHTVSQCQLPHISKKASLFYSHQLKLQPNSSPSFSSSILSSTSLPTFKVSSFSKTEPSICNDTEDGEIIGTEFEDLALHGDAYQNTLRLVECSMFAAVTGLIYFLSNSLSIENYFGCFFSLPIVISSLRWGVAAGRKTVVATAMLLLVLSGPVKALTYLLTHGVVGFTMGSLWRMRADWRISISLCAIARSMGAVGYVLLTSFLIRENIFALITINIHASLTLIFAGIGVNTIPSMNLIYTLFCILVILNSGSFVFLLHILYSVFLTRLGMRDSLRLPAWLEKAL